MGVTLLSVCLYLALINVLDRGTLSLNMRRLDEFFKHRNHGYLGSSAREEGVREDLDSCLALLIPFTNHKLDYQKLSHCLGGYFFASNTLSTTIMSQNYPKIEHSENGNTCCGCQKKPNGVSGKERHSSKHCSYSDTTYKHSG